MLILLSSPYLVLFSDDRVRGTREQMMLMHVVLMILRHGSGDSMGVLLLFIFWK